MDAAADIPASDITLGILAGGRATRLGGIDKAWLMRDGISQVVRIRQCLGDGVAKTLVSANRDLGRYELIDMRAVEDRLPDAGPISGLEALATACATPWLFTLPVDIVEVDARCLRILVTSRASDGAWIHDDDGPQPLCALWRVEALRMAVADAMRSDTRAVHALQSRLEMRAARLQGIRFGNLNTPGDLVDHGFMEH